MRCTSNGDQGKHIAYYPGAHILRWGANKANNPLDQAILEHKEGDDPNVDPFLKLQQAKKKRVDKNERNKSKNVKRSEQANLPGGVAAPSMKVSNNPGLKTGVANTLNLASFSTASGTPSN